MLISGFLCSPGGFANRSLDMRLYARAEAFATELKDTNKTPRSAGRITVPRAVADWCGPVRLGSGEGEPGREPTRRGRFAKARDGADTTRADLPRGSDGDLARGLRRHDDADGRRGGGRE